ncbi:MAG: hypothetical protein O7H41_15510 [Planctomycetota bacterium]|nr:hypothetical protein [Planctomycetota bacterium]
MDAGDTYWPSGRVGFQAVLFPPSMFGVALLLGSIYSGITFIVPRSVATFLPFVTVTVASFAASFTMGLLRSFNVRNATFCFVAGIYAGICLLYISWVTFLALEHGLPRYLDLLTDPGLVWEGVVSVSEETRFEIIGLSLPAWLRWGIWTLEALTFVGVCTGGGWFALDGHVYCEDCDRWAEKTEDFLKLTAIDPDEAASAFKRGEFRGFERANEGEREILRLDIWKCAVCENTIVASLRTAELDESDEGEQPYGVGDLIVCDLIISPRDFARLSSLRRESQGA